MRVTLTPTISPEDRAQLRTALQTAVEAEFGATGERELAVLLHDEADTLRGGLVGTTHWGWLYIRWLWVAEEHRGAGWGRVMLDAAENEAIERGCHGAYIDTFSPRAMALYERCGYAVWGVLEDFPPGHSRRFLKKSLTR